MTPELIQVVSKRFSLKKKQDMESERALVNIRLVGMDSLKGCALIATINARESSSNFDGAASTYTKQRIQTLFLIRKPPIFF